MNNSTSVFHATNEASDVHPNKGFHRQYEHVFEDGQLVRTVLPDFARDIDLRNGWNEPGDTPDDFEAAGESLKKLVRWMIQADTDRPRHLSSIGRRCVALAFVVLGGECGGSWTTMNAAAKELGCTRQSLSKYNAELSELAHGRFARVGSFAGGEARAETSRRRLKQWHRRGRKPRREAPPRQPLTAEQIAAKKERQRVYYKTYHHKRRMRNLEQSLPLGSITETTTGHTPGTV